MFLSVLGDTLVVTGKVLGVIFFFVLLGSPDDTIEGLRATPSNIKKWWWKVKKGDREAKSNGVFFVLSGVALLWIVSKFVRMYRGV